MSNCKFVLTYAYCDWDVNGCIGVYDDPDKVMGRIIKEVFDIWDHSNLAAKDHYKDPEFKVIFRHDDSNDLFYDVEIHYPWTNDTECDIYRVYYLREEDCDGYEDVVKGRAQYP